MKKILSERPSSSSRRSPFFSTTVLLTGGLLASVLLIGCGGTAGDESIGDAAQSLTSAQQRILGFEAPTSDWRSSNGAITSTATKSEGASALNLWLNGYTDVSSVPFEVPHFAATGVSFDLRLGAAVPWGEARVVLKAPSAGVYWQDLGGVSLAGQSAGSFKTLTFNASALNFLAGSATDLEVHVVLNGPSGVQIQLDRLQFLGGSSQSAPSTALTVSLTVPIGQPVQETFISGREKVTIDDRSTLGESGKLDKVSSLGTNGSELGAGVQIHADMTSKGKVAFLRSAAHIYGDVISGDAIVRQNDVQIDGAALQFQSVETATNSWPVSFPAPVGGAISHAPDAANRNLAPGSYTSFQAYSRSTVSFRSGVYYFDSFRVEPQAHIRFRTVSGPVIIYVKNDVTLNAALEYLEGDRGQVLFAALGTAPVILQEAFVGTVVAPNGAIELRRPAAGIHEGSFFGKEVHVFSDATVKFLPFKFSFLCSSGDADRDGVLDCYEECVLDKTKTTAGICGCGVPETDTDGDGLPDCEDECKKDPNHQSRGTCGCFAEADLKPAGTPCSDGIVEGNFTCDGAGTCGNPGSAAPEPGCSWKTLGTHAYWICPNGTSDTAATRCNAASGRRPVRIDSKRENLVLAKYIDAPALIGATDRGVEGEWTWMFTSTLADSKFWTGGAAGRAYGNLFSSFSGGRPANDEALDCAILGKDGSWTVSSCGASAPYLCESVFGSSRKPGPDVPLHTPKGPDGFYPHFEATDDGGPLAQTCEPWVAGTPVLSTKYGNKRLDPKTIEVYDCDDACPEGSDETDCRAACKGEATPPPPGARCSGTGESLTKLSNFLFSPGACAVQDKTTPQDEEACSPATYFGVQIPRSCGIVTTCLQVKQSGSKWETKACSSSADCDAGNTCDSSLKKCVNPLLRNACDPTTQDSQKVCHGQCYEAVGCGIRVNTEASSPTDPNQDCSETTYCPVTKLAADQGLNAGSNLGPSAADTSGLVDQSELPAPPFSGDFQSPCPGGGCGACQSATCDRASRHPWCNLDASLPAGTNSEAGVTDNKKGDRGDSPSDTKSELVNFEFDPGADLNFKLNPLPFGLATFDLNAFAGIKAAAGFDFAGINGKITIVDLKAQLTASLCRVSTADSRAEILGIDFIPDIDEKTGLIFDSAADTENGKKFATDCANAVSTFVDTVDRAKKALRDAQELLTQYKNLGSGQTFKDDFCSKIAGPGVRPKGMPGFGLADPCANETPEETINAFVHYYHNQAGLIKAAREKLATAVLKSSQLQELIGLSEDAKKKVKQMNGFDFYADLGDAFHDEQTTTIISINFFVGPIPCNLEVSSYVNYGISGGFGANLKPGSLIAGAGEFATAGVIVMPHADAGITLFVGAGFDAGPVSLKLGIDGTVTLANIDLPATAKAGLALTRSEDTRALPNDLKDFVGAGYIFPEGGAQKYDFQFVYSYGVGLSISNILGGHINASLIIEFFFFSKKWSQQLIAFEGFTPPGMPIALLSGGSPNPSEWPSSPVKEDTKGWKSTYDSVPFPVLAELQPPAADVVLTKSASFNSAKATELFYDSLCACDAPASDCTRDADCCGNGDTDPTKNFVCFSDPTVGGQGKCSTCRQYEEATTAKPAGVNESCNDDGDCCSNNCGDGKILTDCVPNCWLESYRTSSILTQLFCQTCSTTPGLSDEAKRRCGGYDPDQLFYLGTGYSCKEVDPPYNVCLPPEGGGGGVVR